MNQEKQQNIFQEEKSNSFSIKLIQNSQSQQTYNNNTMVKVKLSLNALIKTMSKSQFFLKRLSQDIQIQQDRRDAIDLTNTQAIAVYSSQIITFKSFRKKTKMFVNVFNQFINASYDLLHRIQMFDDYLIQQEDDLQKNFKLYRNKKIKILQKIQQPEEKDKDHAVPNQQIFTRAFDFESQSLDKIKKFHEYIATINEVFEPLVANLIDDLQSKRILLVLFFSTILELIQKQRNLKNEEQNHDLIIAQIQQLEKRRNSTNDELKALNIAIHEQQKDLKENLQLYYDVKNIYKFEIGKFKKYRTIMRKGSRKIQKK